MTTQESIDRLIGLMDAKMIELEVMQGAMKEVVRFLMQQKDAQGKTAEELKKKLDAQEETTVEKMLARKD